MTTIAGISGSLREHSFNAGLLRAAAESVPDGCSLSVNSIRGIPLYDGDVEDKGTPPAVTDLREKIKAADGLLLVTPEYNNGIPGVFKLHEPEALGYMKLPNGELLLASVFFVTPYAPGPFQGVPPPIYPSEDPPIWLGREPVANTTLGMWEMEVWVWVYNPNGLFDFVNPRFLVDWDER